MSHEIRQIRPPSGWAESPKYMSFSTLNSIESCPLRWSLSHADFSGQWSGKGYPTKMGSSAIIGQVIHTAVENVLNGANSAQGDNFLARMAVTVRELGGLTMLIDLSLSQVLENHMENPRMVTLIDRYRTGLSTLPPTVRTSLQTLLQKVTGMTPEVNNYAPSQHSSWGQFKSALPHGLYTEIKLYADNADWIGIVDILFIGAADVVIEDIKTGKPKDSDSEQLLTYAWLWWRDEKRNPCGRLPTQLGIQYLDSSIALFVPDENELVEFEQNLMQRTEQALATINNEASEARPDTEICRYCDVRQLCDVYWCDVLTSDTAGASHYGDVEAELIGVLSSKSWQIKVAAGSSLPAGTKALLRGNLPQELAEIGSKLRVLDAKVIGLSSDQLSDEIPVIHMLASSEVFIQPPYVEAAK